MKKTLPALNNYKEYVLEANKLFPIQERFDKIGTFGKGVLTVYDAEHAIEEFRNWYPNMDITDYKKVLAKGVKKILRDFGLVENRYMINDKKTGLRIPIHVREDRDTKGYFIGVVATTLGPKELWNKYNEVNLFVESHPWTYQQFPIREGLEYSFYADKNKVGKDFEEIEV